MCMCMCVRAHACIWCASLCCAHAFLLADLETPSSRERAWKVNFGSKSGTAHTVCMAVYTVQKRFRQTEWRHVPRHENKRADDLANEVRVPRYHITPFHTKTQLLGMPRLY